MHDKSYWHNFLVFSLNGKKLKKKVNIYKSFCIIVPHFSVVIPWSLLVVPKVFRQFIHDFCHWHSFLVFSQISFCRFQFVVKLFWQISVFFFYSKLRCLVNELSLKILSFNNNFCWFFRKDKKFFQKKIKKNIV